MKRKHLILLLLLAYVLPLSAQLSRPVEELSAPEKRLSPQEWSRRSPGVQLVWGNADVQYPKYDFPDGTTKKLRLHAWRGERIGVEALLLAAEEAEVVALSAEPLEAGSRRIARECLKVSPLRYVLTDSLQGLDYGCGYRTNKSEWDSLLVADCIDDGLRISLEAASLRPLWLSIDVPRDAAPGTYRGKIVASLSSGKQLSLPYTLQVASHTLPPATAWNFHLDLWQNPYSVARYFGVPLWSARHFELMRPMMERLAHAGQKVITTTVMNRPWNGQTEDPFDSMVGKTKHIDGTWTYDYDVFDRWVTFMMDCGITKQINCYTMVPWALSFDYYDQASHSVRYIQAQPGSREYEEYWLPFLQDFARHLKAKGWFSRTCMALDERAMEQMEAALNILHLADKDFRISSAAHYYENLEPRLYDFCLAYADTIPQAVRERRRAEGKLTTVYTCCAEARPNTFACSPTAEAAWLPVYSYAAGYDGYLRWAYNSWTKEPLQDARFRTWVGGDCFLVYPTGSSVRFERLAEGIQQVEKIKCLEAELKAAGRTKDLQRLHEALRSFTDREFRRHGAAAAVRRLEDVLATY